ncbi:ABC transporter ATP-binding protein [Clostridium tepidum]|jgi:ABC-2 type transport system ATP-binding protein|uniref:Multidrug ABC transporter ATP-binding protein n=1 Tax=Clostridium tepidum TaxID=1962263 RepID=A0A1S9IHL4_9CLOT|nr:ABC transporter ATP-binding protein [Clostridium tepidum]MCR1934585.1 ABC transporter ATP-binding protein [Clostridium tepidum]MDU6877619.1 ABC transporter ATP-binding protein [Clostridium botulinum]OOO62536.1 multidrug ABC transporter ATP-binding protein [Clostridium tepidum]OOO69814.1 multidrug ABC transporter ATP-binding protein [Clostridium tepidum]
MDKILTCSNLKKGYFNKNALNGLGMEVKKGRIVGLLGPNGSGKTTFLKIAAGILKASSGEILIDGETPGVNTKAKVSYLPDKNFLYKWMKIKDAVEFYKDFYADFNEKKCNELLQFMNLDKESKVTALSKGMLEKLLLTLILSRKAKLYLLDEPLGGVDPVSRDKILDAIVNNYSEDSTIIVTTHLVNDIERIFDDVFFISEGEIALSGVAEELRMEKGMSIDELYKEVFK